MPSVLPGSVNKYQLGLCSVLLHLAVKARSGWLCHMVAITLSQELTFDGQSVNGLITQRDITRNLLQLTSFAVWCEQVLLYVATAVEYVKCKYFR